MELLPGARSRGLLVEGVASALEPTRCRAGGRGWRARRRAQWRAAGTATADCGSGWSIERLDKPRRQSDRAGGCGLPLVSAHEDGLRQHHAASEQLRRRDVNCVTGAEGMRGDQRFGSGENLAANVQRASSTPGPWTCASVLLALARHRAYLQTRVVAPRFAFRRAESLTSRAGGGGAAATLRACLAR
jgi:hypothetical protein